MKINNRKPGREESEAAKPLQGLRLLETHELPRRRRIRLPFPAGDWSAAAQGCRGAVLVKADSTPMRSIAGTRPVSPEKGLRPLGWVKIRPSPGAAENPSVHGEAGEL